MAPLHLVVLAALEDLLAQGVLVDLVVYYNLSVSQHHLLVVDILVVEEASLEPLALAKALAVLAVVAVA